MTLEAVDLQVDEAWGDQSIGLHIHLVFGAARRIASADPRDHALFDQHSIVAAVDAMHTSAEQRAHRASLSPSATARSPRAAVKRARAAATSRPQRSIRIASLALPPASRRAPSALSSEEPLSSRTIAPARRLNFSLAVTTSTIRPRYVWLSCVKMPVLIMFRVAFCTVPALRRVDPAIPSGPP